MSSSIDGSSIDKAFDFDLHMFAKCDLPDEGAPKIFKPGTFIGQFGQLSIHATASLFEFDTIKSSLFKDT